MPSDPELIAVGESLKGSHHRVLEVLVLAGAYLQDVAEHDERAAWLAGEIDMAFDAMAVENIAAATVLSEREKGR